MFLRQNIPTISVVFAKTKFHATLVPLAFFNHVEISNAVFDKFYTQEKILWKTFFFLFLTKFNLMFFCF